MSERTIPLSVSRFPQSEGPGPLVYIHQQQDGPVIPTDIRVLLLSPPTTRSATVEYSSPFPRGTLLVLTGSH
jgi:hypothetical protein